MPSGHRAPQFGVSAIRIDSEEAEREAIVALGVEKEERRGEAERAKKLHDELASYRHTLEFTHTRTPHGD